jgi:hypothetical protein
MQLSRCDCHVTDHTITLILLLPATATSTATAIATAKQLQPPILYAQKGSAPHTPMSQAAQQAVDKLLLPHDSNQRCQIIICIKPTKDVADYALIKAASDTIIGVPSQVIVYDYVD